MVPRSLFLDFSLKHASGDYFLRPGCVLGAFHLDPAKHLELTPAAQRLLDQARLLVSYLMSHCLLHLETINSRSQNYCFVLFHHYQMLCLCVQEIACDEAVMAELEHCDRRLRGNRDRIKAAHEIALGGERMSEVKHSRSVFPGTVVSLSFFNPCAPALFLRCHVRRPSLTLLARGMSHWTRCTGQTSRARTTHLFALLRRTAVSTWSCLLIRLPLAGPDRFR